MSDVSFTEMGQALDAASQIRESSTSVSPVDTAGDGANAGSVPEGNPSPSSPGKDAQPPKTDGPAVGDGDSSGNAASQDNDNTVGTPDDKGADERRKQHNQYFAARRLEQKRAKEQRQKEKLLQLQRERDELLQKDDQNSHMLAEMKRERIEEILQQQAEERQQVWEEDCYRIFDRPGEAEQFMAMADKYADYIIRNEPTLNAMVGRPYGKLLLKAWMDRIAEDPARRQEWLGMTEYEKGAVLTHFYGQLEAMGRQQAERRNSLQATMPPAQRGQNMGQPQATQNAPVTPQAPVPGSGRNTSTMPPSNNFALMLQDAMNKRGIKY